VEDARRLLSALAVLGVGELVAHQVAFVGCASFAIRLHSGGLLRVQG
jgi:hypothetical protein